MVDENRIEGAVKNIGGKIQDAVGGLTGDTSTQARGKANQAEGKVQGTYGEVLDDVRSYAADQPIAAVMAAMGVGVLLGFLLGRR